jgi:hypothetical protein
MNSLGFVGALLALVPLACGGTAIEGGGDGGGGDGGRDTSVGDSPSGTDAPSYDATGPWSPVCPETAPTQGSACTTSNLYCEYGCGNVLVCDGTWAGALNPPECPSQPNPSACPANLSSIDADGGTCTGPSTGQCVYPTAVCECDFPFDPTPDAGDAGAWWCGPGPGCPLPRPRIGSPCDKSGLACSYAECGSTETCMGETWQFQDEPCGGG